MLLVQGRVSYRNFFGWCSKLRTVMPDNSSDEEFKVTVGLSSD